MKRALVLPLSLIFVQCCVGQQPSNQPLTDDEKAARVSSWRGEKIMLLPAKRYDIESLNHDNTFNFWLPGQDPQRGLLKFPPFVGRTGTIESVIDKFENGSPPHLVIALDSPSQTINAGIYNSGVVRMGFFTELEAAKQWVGRVLYSKRDS